MYWTVHLEGGPRRVNHAAVLVGERIFSFGGYCTGENYRNRRPMDVHVLKTTNFRWSALPVPNRCDPQYPFQRYGHTAVAYGDKVYVWGGRNDETACNILFCFDTNSLQWSCPEVTGTIPGPRDGHSACIINNYMFVFGGFEEEIDRFSKDVHMLDLRTMRWDYVCTRGDPPAYRDFHTATGFGDKMYIFGGRGDLNGPFHSQEELYCSDIMYLDIRTLQWHRPFTTGTIPLGRRSHSAFVYKDHLYIFGGYNGLFNVHFNDLYRFSPTQNNWERLRPMGKPPSKRRRQSCLVVGDKVFLFGGTSPYNGPRPEYTDDNHPDAKLIDHNDLHILDFSPSLRTLSLLAVIQYNLDISCLPEDIKWELRAMTLNNNISRPLNSTG